MNRSSRRTAHLRLWLQWLKSREPAVLLAVLAIVLGLWAFVEIADEVVEGERATLETQVLRAFRDPQDPGRLIGPVWMEEAVRDITALGGVIVLLLLTGGVSGFLWLDRKRRLAVFVTAAALGGMLASTLLKSVFERPRPDVEVVPQLVVVHSASFPSGHSMMSAVAYLTLGVLVATAVEGRRVKIYCIAMAMFLTLLVGTSRVLLGVHWPSDVLAGWSAGLAWALLCWLVLRILQAEGRVEADETEKAGAADQGDR